MSYRNVREFITQVDKLGALRRVAGADPHFELGGLAEVAAGTPSARRPREIEDKWGELIKGKAGD